MSHTVTVPFGSVSLWVVGISLLATAPVFMAYWRSHWSDLARSFFLVAVLGGIEVLLYALAISQTNRVLASEIFRYLAPLVLLLKLVVLFSSYRLLRRTPPRWYPYLCAGAVVWVLCSIALGPSWDAVTANANGYLIMPVHQAWPMLGIEFGDLLLTVLALYVFVTQFFRKGAIRYRIYAVAFCFTTVLWANDAIWSRFHRSLFPSEWITVLIVWLMTLYELRQEVSRTERLMQVDTLTGANTRGYGELLAAQHFASGDVGALFLDVDNFKAINDEYGHAVGDRVLQEVVQRLRTGARGGDVVIRMGGDEFALVLPSAGRADLAEIMRRVSASFEVPFGFPDVGIPSLYVRVSIGSACASGTTSLEDLLEEADMDMYATKRTKRA